MTAKQTSATQRTNSRGQDAACITTALLFLAATGCEVTRWEGPR